MSAAEAAAGSKLVLAAVTGVTTDSSGKVTAVKVQRQQAATKEELAADAVVLAMGPWTDAARAWLPAAPVTTGVALCVAKGIRSGNRGKAAPVYGNVGWSCKLCTVHVLLL
jgi:glycerol-3-phosphate dehydrogenase